MDLPADASTRILDLHDGNVGPETTGGFLGNNWYWSEAPDEDWIAADLPRGYEYTFELWTPNDYLAKYRASDPKFLGINDTDTDGRHYIWVGSGEGDRTGAHDIRVTPYRLP